MSKLTEAEQTSLKANFEEYKRLHAEACARGEHVWRNEKWQQRFPVIVQECAYCLARREILSDNEGRSGAAPDGSRAPDPGGAIPKA